MSTFKIFNLTRTLNLFRSNFCINFKVTSAFYHTDNGVYGAPKRHDKPINKKLKVYEDYRINTLAWAYRRHGYSIANTDLLDLKQVNEDHPELDPTNYGLDPTAECNASDVLHCNLPDSQMSVGQLVQKLRSLYCGTFAAEFHYIQDIEEREWFAKRFEEVNDDCLTNQDKVKYAKLMLKAQAFEHFLAAKFSTVKRYGGEGAESKLIFYHLLMQLAAQQGVSDMVISMGHRGKLNFLATILQFPLATVFKKMAGGSEFDGDTNALGDVLLHLCSAVDLEFDDKVIHVTMVRTPSHLEVANPVATGKSRARMQSLKTSFYHPSIPPSEPLPQPVLCFHIHGDAAFSGQGVVPETFMLANLPHFSVGGTVHLITNNQIGYTTESDRGRSSTHCSDLGKMIDCPVLRVNAEHPESIAKACKLALEYRQQFQKDIIVDYICYRKYGHNELDEPSFTQPIMYKAIRSRDNIPDVYAAKIVEEGLVEKEELDASIAEWIKHMNSQFKLSQDHTPKSEQLEKQWSGIVQAGNHLSTWETGVDVDLLKYVGAKSVTIPPDFVVHPTLQKTHIDRRLQRLQQGTNIDWATGEALAIGTLLMQGKHVRISGQDVGRGTFSQRHAMFVEQETDEAYVPLNDLHEGQQAFYEVVNSPLSEEAVMAFEFGFSTENPHCLVMWEAQFGDFYNGAQIVVDTFITGSETKWLVHSALVLLLPHGIDGTGPEHSSCRIERFLQLTDSKEEGVDGDDVNFQVAYPTTPAQMFHLFRRQMVRNFRKPLVIVGPKGMLRMAQVTSDLSEMGPGTHFKNVISDPDVQPSDVKRVIFLTGKHYYTLKAEREKRGRFDVALVRVESLCPFPTEDLQKEVKKYKKAQTWLWGQEEHRNQGAWTFVNTRFKNLVGIDLRYCGRSECAIPAVGISSLHKREVEEVNEESFK